MNFEKGMCDTLYEMPFNKIQQKNIACKQDIL